MRRNANSPGTGLPGLSYNINAGETNLAAETANHSAPRGREEQGDVRV